MKNDRESRKSLNALLKNVETKRRGNKNTISISCTLISCKLVCTMRSTDCDCKRVTACSINELFYFFRTCISFITRLYTNFIFDTSQSTKLCLYYNAVSMCILNNLLGQCNVLLKRLGRSIDHNGCESTIDTGFT